MDDDAFEYLAIRTEPEQYSGRPEEPGHYIHEVSGKVVFTMSPAPSPTRSASSPAR
jgi:hypothetical protein